MILLFVLSIIYKMALYMIYANFVIHILSLSLYEHEHGQHIIDAYGHIYALFYGGHPLLASALHNFTPLFVISRGLTSTAKVYKL